MKEALKFRDGTRLGLRPQKNKATTPTGWAKLTQVQTTSVDERVGSGWDEEKPSSSGEHHVQYADERNGYKGQKEGKAKGKGKEADRAKGREVWNADVECWECGTSGHFARE